MSRTRMIRAGALVGFLTIPALPAMADIQWNGFMSIGAGMTLDTEEQASGYDDDLSFAPDSVLGLQADADLGDRLTATAQLIAHGETHEVEAEWLYFGYELQPDLRLNLGRQRLPMYYYSDYLEVGYAYHFVRPPVTVYSSVFSAFDGVSLLYGTFFGDLEAKVQLTGGSYKKDDLDFGELEELSVDAEDYFGAVVTLVYDDWLTFRASYHDTEMTVGGAGWAPVQQLATAARTLGFGQVANAIAAEEMHYRFGGIAVAVEYNDYLFIAEATHQKLQTLYDEQKSFYVSAAKRFGSVMPYVTVERIETHSDNSLYRNIPPTSVAAATLRAQLQGAINASDYNGYVYSLGARYDFHPRAALKVEYSQGKDQRNEQALGVTNRDARLVSFTLDTLF